MTRPITDLATLEALYGEPGAPSLAKEVPQLTPGYRALIEASPFFVLATSGPGGLDASPRGDGPGFVRVADERTLLIPDRRGNNRIDSLRNVLADPRVGLLFLVPGVNETLRVNGRAVIDADSALCESFAVDGKPPKSVLAVTVESVFFQCARALLRSRLWDPAVQVPRASLPSTGALLAEASAGREGGEAYERSLAERIPKTLY
ncbi:pyridoxamine 5'-phosphate oxidase family protein [Azospirillum doebereinerae]|uniref:pyridoxamine 5'-phosphate oxidase family protein n=1 Tax=Azospirillum doebereinerae TaxID=92933 RepID=UPI001EE5FF39|nr:pyridoxamine 5'-phosphate oxidase family protein [Azospirillum doebereinerae]MCG5240182.1 pyridoxamine 5'-phosphate oxidase family protein [Azospirillum doebereinerae]